MGSSGSGCAPRRTDFDLRSSDAFVAAYPGVRTAFDGAAMARGLSDVLGVDIVACQPEQALFEPDGYCMVRYRVELHNGGTAVVSARLFGDAEAADAFRADALEPSAADLDTRSHRPRVPVLAATLPAPAMAVSVFPVDGELPTLVRVTDPDEAATVLAGSLPAGRGPYRVTAANYGRRRRCALRFETGDPGAPVAYGKVANDGGGRQTRAVTDALRAAGADFDVPRVLVDRPELGLTVLEGIAGAPRVAQLLRARVCGTPPPSDAPRLEVAVAACGRIAATVHRIEVPIPRRRTLDVELVGLRAAVEIVRSYAPGLTARLEPALVSAESRAARTEAAADVTAHGDFSYTQLLFAGDRQGLVDFDGVCRAEPALDLGHFLAYLRFARVKAAGGDALRFAPLEDELERVFLDGYRSVDGSADVDDERIRLSQTVSLVRLAVHAWQKMKPERLERILTALDSEVVPVVEAVSDR